MITPEDIINNLYVFMLYIYANTYIRKRWTSKRRKKTI